MLSWKFRVGFFPLMDHYAQLELNTWFKPIWWLSGTRVFAIFNVPCTRGSSMPILGRIVRLTFCLKIGWANLKAVPHDQGWNDIVNFRSILYWDKVWVVLIYTWSHATIFMQTAAHTAFQQMYQSLLEDPVDPDITPSCPDTNKEMTLNRDEKRDIGNSTNPG